MYDPKSVIQTNPTGIYKNKTLRYIAPTLKGYGKEFVGLLNKLPINAFTIGDLNYCDSLSDYIYLVVSTVNLNQFNSFIEYVSNKDYFVDDYIYSLSNRQHCIVLKNPVPYVIDNFLAGKYSEMYPEEIINRFFMKTVTIKNIEHYTDVYAILTKRPEYIKKFQEYLLLDFGANIEVDSNTELDYPPIIGEEVLNTKEELNIDQILNQQIVLDKLKNKVWT